MTALSDAALLARFRAGDETSFAVLFERHYDMVYGVLYRMTNSRAEAEDLVQEVFLKLYRRPLRHHENIAGWLYRVATNTGYNALRAARRQAQREHRVTADEAVIHGRPPTPEDQLARRETRQEVQAALASIRPRSAKLLILRESGLSYKALAESIGVAPGSVGTLLARARAEFEEAYRTTVEEDREDRDESPE